MAWIVKSVPKNDVVNEKYPPPFQLAVVLVNFVEFLSCKKKSFKMVTEIWSKLKDKDIEWNSSQIQVIGTFHCIVNTQPLPR